MSTISRQIIGENDDKLRRIARSGLGLPAKNLYSAWPFLTGMPEYAGPAGGSTMGLEYTSHNTRPIFVVIQCDGRRADGTWRVYWRAHLYYYMSAIHLQLEIGHHWENASMEEVVDSASTLEQANAIVREDARRFVDKLRKYVKIAHVYDNT